MRSVETAVLDLDTDPGASRLEPPGGGSEGRYSVDARNAAAVQVGDGSTQINYSYQGIPWLGITSAPQVSWAGSVQSPYRGLSAYGERDAAFFFGREPAATEIIERVSRRLAGLGLVVLSGVSGVGKSSLVHAGVLPRLRGAGLPGAPGSAAWPCLVFTPARAPLDELAVRVAGLAGVDAAAVRRGLETDPAGFALTARQAALNGTLNQAVVQLPGAPDPRLILVVDQFEQLFTQCPDEREREAFVRALCAAAGRNLASQRVAALVVLIVRADFEARCADYPGLASAVQDRYLVLPMTERQLRAAITEPAKVAGGRIDGDLVDVLLREVGSQLHEPASGGRRTVLTSPAGVLPLVSYALDQAWRQSSSGTVNIGDYERTGGIESAVANSAQHAYERLTSDQQAAARQVFIRLTATSPEGIDVARRVRLADLTEGKNPRGVRDVEHVLDRFVTERLLTVDAGTVEISHEVLLAAWPLLRDDWLAETHADRVVRTRLSGVVAEWTRSSRNPSYLYGGTVLEAATAMAARAEADPASVPPPSREERDFLDISIRAERRKARRRKGIIALLTAAAVALAVAAALAEAARGEAERQRNANASRQLAFHSQIIGIADPRVADLEAVAAWQISPSSQARYALLVAAARPETAVLQGSTGPVNPVTFSPDGKFVATGSLTVRLWYAGTLRPASRPLATGIGQANSITFSPDSRVLAIAGGNWAGDSGVVELRDVPSGRPTGQPLRGGSAEFNAVAFSPDGSVIAACNGVGQVWLWSARTHRLLTTLDYAKATAEALAFSPDGKSLVVAGYAGTKLWDVATGRLIGHLQDRGEFLNSVAFSPDGRVIATGGQDGQVRLWGNVDRQPLLLRRLGVSGTGSVNSLAFRAGGRTLAVGTRDGTVRLWDVVSGRQQGVLSAPTGGVNSVAFAPSGSVLAAGDSDGSVRLWDTATILPAKLLSADRSRVTTVAFRPSGTILAAGAADGSVRLWDAAADRQARNLHSSREGGVDSVAFGPHGLLAVGYHVGAMRLWETATGQADGAPVPVGTLPGVSVAFSPGGTTVATADGTVRLWRVRTREPIGRYSEPPDGPFRVAFSPGGKILAVAGGSNADFFTGIVHDSVVDLWDVASHRRLGEITSRTGGFTAIAFSPDGKTLATADGDGTVRLWGVATLTAVGSPMTAEGPAGSVTFSPDGHTLAVGYADAAVQLWDVTTHQRIGAPLLTGGPANSVAFSPDGKILAVGDGTPAVELWDVSYLQNLLPELCSAAGGALTPTEWDKYVPQGPAYQKICP